MGILIGSVGSGVFAIFAIFSIRFSSPYPPNSSRPPTMQINVAEILNKCHPTWPWIMLYIYIYTCRYTTEYLCIPPKCSWTISRNLLKCVTWRAHKTIQLIGVYLISSRLQSQEIFKLVGEKINFNNLRSRRDELKMMGKKKF